MRKIVLLSLIVFSTVVFADSSVYRVKSGMLACYEKSLATKAFALVQAVNDPHREKNIQKLLAEGKCIIFGKNDQFKILQKHTKGGNGIFLDYLKIKKIKDSNNKEAQRVIDHIRKNGTAKEKRELEQMLTGWVRDLRKSEKSFMYDKVR